MEQLERETGEKAAVEVNYGRGRYRAVKNDIIDELIARVINELDLNLPVARICEGWYLFGQKKINAKVQGNKNILVRVGGGYCEFREFIETYA